MTLSPKKIPDQDQILGLIYSKQPVPESFETGWRAAIRREESIQMSQNKKSRSFARKFFRVAGPVFAAFVLVIGALVVGEINPKTLSTGSAPAIKTASEPAYGDRKVAGLSAVYDYGAMPEAVPYEMAEEVAYDYAPSSNGMASGAAKGEPKPQIQQRKLVRTVTMTLRTTAFESDLAQIQGLLAEVGGYIEDSYQTGDPGSNTLRRSTLTMRVPSDKLDGFISGISGVGRVTERSETAKDMTVEYYDNETRLETLRQKMARLQELLSQAVDMDDLIELENAISDTQYQIDSYTTYQRTIDQQVDYSTVSLTLREENAAQVATVKQVSFWERVTSGFKATLMWLGDFFSNLAVFIIMMLPVFAVIAVIVVIIVLVSKKARKNRAARRNSPENKEDSVS